MTGLAPIYFLKDESSGRSSVSETSLPDELNAFYSNFGREITNVPSRYPIGIVISDAEANGEDSL